MTEKLLEIARAIVRPIATLAFVFTTLWMIIHGKDLPEFLVTNTSLMIGFWFVERALSHAKNGNGNNGNNNK